MDGTLKEPPEAYSGPLVSRTPYLMLYPTPASLSSTHEYLGSYVRQAWDMFCIVCGGCQDVGVAILVNLVALVRLFVTFSREFNRFNKQPPLQQGS